MRITQYNVQLRETESKLYVELWVSENHCLHTDYLKSNDYSMNQNALQHAINLRDRILEMKIKSKPIINRTEDGYFRVVVNGSEEGKLDYLLHSEKVNLKTAIHIRDRLMNNE